MEESSNPEPQVVTKKPEESGNPEIFLKEEQGSQLSHNSNLADAESEKDVPAEKLDETDVLSEETTVAGDGSPMEAKEIEDANFQALRENPNGIPPILTDVYEEDAEVQLLSSDEKPESSSEVVVTDAEPKGTDQSLGENVKAPSPDFTGEETEERTEPGLEENAKDSSSSAEVDKGSMENPDDSSKTSAASNPETTASNYPIISLRDGSGQPATATTWMSCCGLFEVLRRSNR